MGKLNMSCRFFVLDFFYSFKLFEYSEYMVIYQIENFRNFDRFPTCEILKIW